MPRKTATAADTDAKVADPDVMAPAMATEGIQDLSFEDAIDELEGIVERMELGELSLQDSLSAYQRGAALVTRCRGALDSVSQQVKVLEGNLLKPLNPDDVSGESS